MTAIKAPPTTSLFYPLRALRGLPGEARVDQKRRIIFGAAMIQLGEVNDDRPFIADEVTLQQALQFSAQRNKGLKARFTHPNVSNDGLGKFLGRWKVERLSDGGQFLLGDLHLSNMAFRGADGGFGQYVLDLADQEPDVFGVSLAPRYDEEEMEKLRRKDGLMPIRFRGLIAADVVDEPAATRGGLFGDAPLSINTAPHQATQALDSLFSDAQPEVIRGRVVGFLDSYLANRFGGSTLLNEEKKDMSNTQQNTDQAFGAEDAKKMIEESNAALLSVVEKKLDALKLEPVDEPKHSQDDLLAERTRCIELRALAKNANLSDCDKIADGWIEKGLSVVEAKAAIADMAIASNGLSHDAGDGNEDPDGAYKKEYRENQAAIMIMGLSEQEYVDSRKIDDNKLLLAPTEK